MYAMMNALTASGLSMLVPSWQCQTPDQQATGPWARGGQRLLLLLCYCWLMLLRDHVMMTWQEGVWLVGPGRRACHPPNNTAAEEQATSQQQ